MSTKQLPLEHLTNTTVENTAHFLNEVIPQLEIKFEEKSLSNKNNNVNNNMNNKLEKEPDMPDFLYESMLQHQIQYTGNLSHVSIPVKETNVSMEDIYFQAEKLDPMLNSLSHKYKEEEKQDIKHYMKITQQLESKKSFRLADKIETRRPSFYTNTNPMSKN